MSGDDQGRNSPANWGDGKFYIVVLTAECSQKRFSKEALKSPPGWSSSAGLLCGQSTGGVEALLKRVVLRLDHSGHKELFEAAGLQTALVWDYSAPCQPSRTWALSTQNRGFICHICDILFPKH